MTHDGNDLLTTPALQLPMDVEPLGDDLVVVTVRGEIDLSEAGELRAVLNDACTGRHRSVAVDLSAVHFLGSTGMSVLAEVSQRMTDDGRCLTVLEPSEAIRHAFGIAGLSHVLA